MIQEQQSQDKKQFDRSKLKSKSRSDIFIEDNDFETIDQKVNQFNIDHNHDSYQLANTDQND